MSDGITAFQVEITVRDGGPAVRDQYVYLDYEKAELRCQHLELSEGERIRCTIEKVKLVAERVA